MFTNVQIDVGFVASSLAPMIVVLACTDSHLRAAWRICLGLGVIPPLSLIYLRLKLQEPEEFNRETMKNTRTPWFLVIKYAELCDILFSDDRMLIVNRFYWARLLVVSTIWFIYDFLTYSFSIYSSAWLLIILGDGAPLWKTFGWNTIINLFYLPGAIGGAFLSDILGPKVGLSTSLPSHPALTIIARLH